MNIVNVDGVKDRVNYILKSGDDKEKSIDDLTTLRKKCSYSGHTVLGIIQTLNPEESDRKGERLGRTR